MTARFIKLTLTSPSGSPVLINPANIASVSMLDRGGGRVYTCIAFPGPGGDDNFVLVRESFERVEKLLRVVVGVDTP